MRRNHRNTEAAAHTTVCAKCGRRVLKIYTVTDSETAVCLDCFRKYYYRCSKCGKIKRSDLYDKGDYHIRLDNDYLIYYDIQTRKNRFICRSCQKKDEPINHSEYTPDLNFYNNGIDMRYFGTELEVDIDEEKNNICELFENNKGHAYNVLSIANSNQKKQRIYIKSDGSLENGFEIVSHPMSLSYHMNNMPWQEIMSYLVSEGYLSGDTSTCGLHIHVNRTSMGSTVLEEGEAIARLLYFTSKFQNELTVFSRRTTDKLNRWAKFFSLRDSPQSFLRVAKCGDTEKYSAVNLENKDTIEFRFYRGTLNYNTFIAALQLTDELCEIAVRKSDDEIMNISWNGFINNINHEKKSELIMYLKKRGLYRENNPQIKEVF